MEQATNMTIKRAAKAANVGEIFMVSNKHPKRGESIDIVVPCYLFG
jgi:hypothetical protein